MGTRFSITTKSDGTDTSECSSSPGERTLADSNFHAIERTTLNGKGGSTDQCSTASFRFPTGRVRGYAQSEERVQG